MHLWLRSSCWRATSWWMRLSQLGQLPLRPGAVTAVANARTCCICGSRTAEALRPMPTASWPQATSVIKSRRSSSYDGEDVVGISESRPPDAADGFRWFAPRAAGLDAGAGEGLAARRSGLAHEVALTVQAELEARTRRGRRSTAGTAERTGRRSASGQAGFGSTSPPRRNRRHREHHVVPGFGRRRIETSPGDSNSGVVSVFIVDGGQQTPPGHLTPWRLVILPLGRRTRTAAHQSDIGGP